MSRNRFDFESEERAHREVVTVATAILDGSVGIIEGARQLSALAHDVVDDWRADSDFVVFGALDSSTDHLPIGRVREYWDPVALVDRDREVKRIETDARPKIEQACRNLLQRFADV
jgi:hypothetical protein